MCIAMFGRGNNWQPSGKLFFLRDAGYQADSGELAWHPRRVELLAASIAAAAAASAGGSRYPDLEILQHQCFHSHLPEERRVVRISDARTFTGPRWRGCLFPPLTAETVASPL